MNLCSDNHDEVCFEGRHCPVCALKAEHKEELEAKEEKISDLESQLEACHDNQS